MQQKVVPTGVTVDKTLGILKITWTDGASCEYPLANLREACPCVECRGGHSRMGQEYDPDDILKLVPKRSYAIQSVELVGSYALQPTWDDGHSTGIYTWEYLRRLCPPQ
jgi:DUF971 family protein